MAEIVWLGIVIIYRMTIVCYTLKFQTNLSFFLFPQSEFLRSISSRAGVGYDSTGSKWSPGLLKYGRGHAQQDISEKVGKLCKLWRQNCAPKCVAAMIPKSKHNGALHIFGKRFRLGRNCCKTKALEISTLPRLGTRVSLTGSVSSIGGGGVCPVQKLCV